MPGSINHLVLLQVTLPPAVTPDQPALPYKQPILLLAVHLIQWVLAFLWMHTLLLLAVSGRPALVNQLWFCFPRETTPVFQPSQCKATNPPAPACMLVPARYEAQSYGYRGDTGRKHHNTLPVRGEEYGPAFG